MWIYEENDEGKFVVGHYDPKKEFHEESTHADRFAAAHRVHFLNGGTLPYRPGPGAPAANDQNANQAPTGDEPAADQVVNSAEVRKQKLLRRGIAQ